MASSSAQKTYAIRFGLGAIKAVGFNMMSEAVKEREENGPFKDVYDFAKRSDPKSINKKSIEALAKSGAFDHICNNRRQVSESFEILSNYATEAKEEANSNQMNLFGGISDSDSLPALKTVSDWTKKQKLNCEFEAFGFFLNEHPIDDRISELKLRGIIFSPKIEEDSLEDNSIIKMAGVVASSKHRSGSRGRFAYLNISDPFGIYEATIFDEALITANRDLLEDGCEIVIECLIRKDEGGTRIMVKGVSPLDNFIQDNKPANKEFEDIKKLPNRKNDNRSFKNNTPNVSGKTSQTPAKKEFEVNLGDKNDAKTSNKTYSPNLDNKVLEEKIIKKLEILIGDEKAILPLKTILSQKKSDDGNAKIFLVATRIEKDSERNLTTKIELSGNYKIQDLDVFRLKNLHPKIQIISVS